jgi:hypothetical protein
MSDLSDTRGVSVAKAGFCTQCNSQVWLKDDGSCVNGHPAGSVSGVFEAAPAAPVPVASATAAGSTPWPWLIAGIAVVAAIVVFASRPATPAVDPSSAAVFQSASANAQLKSCQANQRIVMGAIQTYQATYPERGSVPSDWSGAMTALIPDMIKVEPRCPAGGTYHFVSAGTVECSIHGGLD